MPNIQIKSLSNKPSKMISSRQTMVYDYTLIEELFGLLDQ